MTSERLGDADGCDFGEFVRKRRAVADDGSVSFIQQAGVCR
jgi:hypothetical protein